MHRTGTADLNKLGGLVTRMPLTFLVLLFGIISLAGLPPMAGFVSKWMVYRSLITEGMPLLFVAAIVGTLGTILSVYKLIHNIFLGQLRVEHEQVREAPLSMLIPMLGLSTLIFLAGFMPGPALSWVAEVQRLVGPAGGQVQPGRGRGSPRRPGHDLAGEHPHGRLRGRGLGLLWLWRQVQAGPPARQLRGRSLPDGGGPLPVQRQLLRGLMHLIGPWYRGAFLLAGGVRRGRGGPLSYAMHWIYRSIQPLLFLLATTVAMLVWAAV